MATKRIPDAQTRVFTDTPAVFQFGEGVAATAQSVHLISAVFRPMGDVLTLTAKRVVDRMLDLFASGDFGRDGAVAVSSKPTFQLLREALPQMLEWSRLEKARVDADVTWYEQRVRPIITRTPKGINDTAHADQQREIRSGEALVLCRLAQECFETAREGSQPTAGRTSACIALALVIYVGRVVDLSVAFLRQIGAAACLLPNIPASLIELLREVASDSRDVGEAEFEGAIVATSRRGLSFAEANFRQSAPQSQAPHEKINTIEGPLLNSSTDENGDLVVVGNGRRIAVASPGTVGWAAARVLLESANGCELRLNDFAKNIDLVVAESTRQIESSSAVSLPHGKRPFRRRPRGTTTYSDLSIPVLVDRVGALLRKLRVGASDWPGSWVHFNKTRDTVIVQYRKPARTSSGSA